MSDIEKAYAEEYTVFQCPYCNTPNYHHPIDILPEEKVIVKCLYCKKKVELVQE